MSGVLSHTVAGTPTDLRRRWPSPVPSGAYHLKTSPRGVRDAATLAFYAERATAYADATWPLPVDGRLRGFAAMAPAGWPIVDVGCGSGRDLAGFRAVGRSAIGIDRSEALARIASARSSCPVIVADVAEMPFGPRSLGGIWASASLLHLPHWEMGRAVASLTTLLAPGGVIFVSLKSGEGSARGDDGRLFAFHTDREVDGVATASGLVVVDRRVDTDAASGGQRWISFVARSS